MGFPGAAGEASQGADASEARLVAACQQGDAAAFEELVRRYKDRIYTLAYRFLGNHEDSQDLCQETFVKAYQAIGGFRGNARFFTWLYSIAVNLARNRVRDGGRLGRNKGVSLEDAPAQALALPADLGGSPRDTAMRHELEDSLQACLNELPDHYRLVFILRVMDGLSYEAIAGLLTCPKGTVKSRLNQARALLRGKLEERGLL